MRITITGRNIDITDGLRSAVEDKLSKLEKYFTPDTDVFVTLSVEKERHNILLAQRRVEGKGTLFTAKRPDGAEKADKK